MAIFGPFTTTQVETRSDGTRSKYVVKRGYKTKPLRSAVTSYKLNAYLSGAGDAPNTIAASAADGTIWQLSDVQATAQNRCYKKVVDALGDRASLGETLAEGREAMEMIYQRFTTLGSAYSSLKKGDFLGAARTLGIPRKAVPKKDRPYRHNQQGSSIGDSLADHWLEYWFGWAPLVDDITTGFALLDKPFKEGAILRRSASDGVYHDVNVYPGGAFTTVSHADLSVFVKMGTKFIIHNENAYRASQLGLTNLAGTAFALLPFSFFLDWVANASQYLGQWSDFGGVTLIDPYTSIARRANGSVIRKFKYETKWNTLDNGVGTLFERYPTILGPQFHIHGLRTFSASKAATAASFLHYTMR